jgi:2-C-methyl-D-erythritol 4-phosphate cytidylyltransferase
MADPAGSTVRTVAAVLAAPVGGAAGAALLARLAGRPVIEHSVAAFEASPLVGEVLVVRPRRPAGCSRPRVTARCPG